MALTLLEVRAGTVAYLDVAVLNADPLVQKPANPTTRNGPFVCFAVNGANTGWAPITGQYSQDRLELQQAWRTGGAGGWQQADQYLNDGDTTYVGPSSSFVAASQHTDTFRALNRPKLARAGVAAVVAEIKAKGGLIP